MEINTSIETKEKKTKKGTGVSDSKDDGHGVDIIATSDYKVNSAGKKYRAHRIVFNKGEDDGKRPFNGVTEHMKKTYKEFVAEKLKGDQHKLDKNKNGKLDKHDFKMLRKEESESIEEMDELMQNSLEEKNSSAFDWKNSPRQTKDKSTTSTNHDVKKISTGTVYTKQRDADGMSKEFKRDPDTVKRGRGRPKKNSFSEAAEFLMSLDEETFESLMEEGFDAFIEQFEQLDELSKSTLASYAKHAAVDAKGHGYNAGYSDGDSDARAKKMSDLGKGGGSVHDDKAYKRLRGVKKAIDRLVK